MSGQNPWRIESQDSLEYLSRTGELACSGRRTLRSRRLKSRLEIDWRKVGDVEEGKGGAVHEAGMGYRGESSRHVDQVANLVAGARFLVRENTR